jgi:Phage integrase, N-terminal SAM-like domain.
MKEEETTPLRQRMIEDMRMRGVAEKTQAAHVRAVKDFAAFLRRSPDTATPEDLRAYQRHMTNAGMGATTFKVRIVSLRVVRTCAAPRFPPTFRHDLRAGGE